MNYSKFPSKILNTSLVIDKNFKRISAIRKGTVQSSIKDSPNKEHHPIKGHFFSPKEDNHLYKGRNGWSQKVCFIWRFLCSEGIKILHTKFFVSLLFHTPRDDS